MKILEKLNLIYGKFLYLIVPGLTVGIAILAILDNRDTSILNSVANIVMGFISISFLGFYMMSQKQNIVYFLIEIYLFYYTTFLFVANKMKFGDFAWIIFICTAIFGLFFILFLNRNYKKTQK